MNIHKSSGLCTIYMYMPFKILSVDPVTTVNINSVVLKADLIRFKFTVFQRGKYDNRFWSANHKKKKSV